MDQCRKKLEEKIEKEALDKYKVEDNTRGAYRGRGSIFFGMTEYESGGKIVGQEFSLCARIVTCSVCKSCMKIRRKEKR